MATYKYRAKKGVKEVVEGRLEAQSEKEAIEKLSSMGYLPIRIEPDARPLEAGALSAGRPKVRVRSREITIFSRQLASLLRAGVPILDALNTIAQQSENRNLKDVLRHIHDAVKEGSTFSSALSQFPNLFSPLYISMIRSGENSGAIQNVLSRIVEYRAKQEEMLSRIRMSMAYPLLMAIVGLGTIIFMLTFVMPRLMTIFVNLGEKLPLPTRILISISEGVRSYWLWLAVLLVIIIFAAGRQIKTAAGRSSLSALKLHIPVFGQFVLKAELARFARTLEMLIKNGIPILKAIDISLPILDNEILKNKLRQSYKDLEDGGSFGKSLKDSKAFPVFMANLISVGEESGKLDEALSEVATSYEHDTDEALRVMSSLLEPIMILVMGLIVGFIVVAMLLPVFEINIMAK